MLAVPEPNGNSSAGASSDRAVDDEQQRLRDFARASGDWLWETDDELRYTFVTEGITASTGELPADLIGQPIADAALLDEHGPSPAPGTGC